MDHDTRQALVYADPRWRRLRAWVLEAWPQCCGCGCKAVILDHIVPVNRDHQLARAFSVTGVQGLCRVCHARKTETIDAPMRQPGLYRRDRAHLADMRPAAMREWASMMEANGTDLARVGSPKASASRASRRRHIVGDLSC